MEGDQRQVSFASGAWMIISKNVFEKTYLFDSNMFFGEEDAEFCRRAKKKGFPILYIPDIVVYHKVGESANSRKRPELNLYHIQSKIYNVAKSYSVLFSLPYFFSFYVYQVSLSILEKDKRKTIFGILKKIPDYYVKGILAKNK